MYVFVVGMERCGTHSVTNIVKNACKLDSHVVHEEPPLLCHEAKLIFEGQEFRTEAFKEKVRLLHGKKGLVCEANHRFGYFITLLMREFAPDCKFIFLVRDPIETIVSRISTWAYYPDHLEHYPDFYKRKVVDNEFNRFRIGPKNFNSLIFLYAWEWIENYKFCRKELACIPPQNRLIMSTEDITNDFYKILGFIGMEYFNIDEKVIGWSRVKSDSVYVQPKQTETDIFVTNNRDPISDETVIFAKEQMNKNKKMVVSFLLEELLRLENIDVDFININKKILGYIT